MCETKGNMVSKTGVNVVLSKLEVIKSYSNIVSVESNDVHDILEKLCENGVITSEELEAVENEICNEKEYY